MVPRRRAERHKKGLVLATPAGCSVNRPALNISAQRCKWHSAYAFILACAVTLAGCATQRTAPTTPTKPSDRFTVLGKMAVRGANQPVSARFRWSQDARRFAVELWGPFGQGRRRLAGNDSFIEVVDAQGQVLQQGPPAQVMQQNLGFELPLGALRYWLQGVPDPGQPATDRQFESTDGALRRFRQAGWLVELPQRFPAGQPKVLQVVGRGYEVRLVLTRWLAPEAV